jgi:hypothetical protein
MTPSVTFLIIPDPDKSACNCVPLTIHAVFAIKIAGTILFAKNASERLARELIIQNRFLTVVIIMMPKTIHTQLVYLFILFISGQTAHAVADEFSKPFKPGEKLVFELKWTVVPAGEAALEVMPFKKINGEDAYHFVLTAKTNRFLDPFYKVRDRIDGYTDLDITRSVFFSKRQREGKTKKNVVVKFDWAAQTAEYTEFIKQAKKHPIELMPGALDPLSIFYYTRMLPLQIGEDLQRPVTDGKKCVMGKARIVRREKIIVPAGEFDTFLMVPDLQHVGGVFKKSKNAIIELWVSADNRRLPVKLKSEVIVGSFTGELISYTP